MNKVTLKTLAEQLGISVGTVSKALKNYDDISDDTKQKVHALAEKLNFKPNTFAQSLRNNESKIIGLIVPQLVHHFFSNMVLGAIKAAEKKGYVIITMQSDESYDVEMKQINLLIDRNVDGIMMSLADDTVNYKHLSKLIEDGLPIVLMDKITKSVDCSKVVINDRKAAFKATDYLLKSGCRRVAHIRGPLKPQTTIDRFNGYKDALAEHNIAFDKSIVFETPDLSFENGKAIAKQIAEKYPEIDGIFAFTDLTATGALVGLKEVGKNIPNDISIVGFSNWFLTKITTPTLTTIDQPGFTMGETAFNMLYKEIQERKLSPKTVNFQTKEIATDIIIRNSTNNVI